MPAGPCSRWTTSRSSCSPRSRACGRRLDVGQRLLERGVGPPREPPRDLGVGGELQQRRRRRPASGGAASAWDHAGRCSRCCTTSTATYPRCRPSWPTPARAAPATWLLGGDVVAFGGDPVAVDALLGELRAGHVDPGQHGPLAGRPVGLRVRRGADARRRPRLPLGAGRRARRRARRAAGERAAPAGVGRRDGVARLPGVRPALVPPRAGRRRGGAPRRRAATRAWSSATPTCPSGAWPPAASSSSTPARSACPSTATAARPTPSWTRTAPWSTAASTTTGRPPAEAVLAAAGGAAWGDVIARRLAEARP